MNNGPWQPHTPCTGYYVMKQGRNLAPASERGGIFGWGNKKKPAPRTIVTDFLRLWWDQDWHLNLCDGELKDQCTLWNLLNYGESRPVNCSYSSDTDPANLTSAADLGLKKVPGEAAALFRKRGVVCEFERVARSSRSNRLTSGDL